MSQPKLEFVRAVYRRWETGDFTPATERFDDRTTLVMRPEFPEAGTYTGPVELHQYMLAFLGAWEKLVIEAETFTEGGDAVVVGVHQEGTGKGSGVPVAFRYFHVWTFTGDTVASIEAFMERDEAMAAAGIAE